jgi:hypothetical protein
MESLFSFPVGLFHPLQHAGLSRRTPACRPSGTYRMVEPNAALVFFEGIETQTGSYNRFQRVHLF